VRIKLTVGYPNWSGIRQTPQRAGVWEDCEFVINQDCESCDAWVVLQSSKGLLTPETTHCPPENLVLITREPPDMMTWPDAYLRQFSMVVTCHPNLKHPNVLLTQHGQTWHLERHSFDDLLKIPTGAKPKLMSVICSDKTYTPGHRTRLQLLKVLKQHFQELDVFGRNVQPIADKWDGIYPYKYHIVLENGSFPDYWTEKLTDAYLGHALPIYYGCPNLADYFSPQAFIQIDPADIDQTIHTIEQAIATHQYEQSLTDIAQARHLVLNHYNLFPMLANLCRQLPGRAKRNVTLCPEFKFKSTRLPRVEKVGMKIRKLIGLDL
jgi:Glycosyltransferase family 10 (fucosyltransferase) C-term